MLCEPGQLKHDVPRTEAAGEVPAKLLQVAFAEQSLEAPVLLATGSRSDPALADHDVERVGGDPCEEVQPSARRLHHVAAQQLDGGGEELVRPR